MSTYVGDLKKPSIGVATVWLGWVSWFITRVYGRLVGGGQISDPGGGKESWTHHRVRGCCFDETAVEDGPKTGVFCR
jgi:hypothetical protein